MLDRTDSERTWAAEQQKLHSRLSHNRTQLKLLLNREGRFSTLSDERWQKPVDARRTANQVDRDEILLVDKDWMSRIARIEREARSEAAAVDEETREKWLRQMVEYMGFDQAWVRRWRDFFEGKSLSVASNHV